MTFDASPVLILALGTVPYVAGIAGGTGDAVRPASIYEHHLAIGFVGKEFNGLNEGEALTEVLAVRAMTED